MTETLNTYLEVTDVGMLQPGDYVEARRGDVIHLRGTVDSMAPDLGIVWITEPLPGYRRIIDPQEFSIWLRPRQMPGDRGISEQASAFNARPNR